MCLAEVRLSWAEATWLAAWSFEAFDRAWVLVRLSCACRTAALSALIVWAGALAALSAASLLFAELSADFACETEIAFWLRVFE